MLIWVSIRISDTHSDSITELRKNSTQKHHLTTWRRIAMVRQHAQLPTPYRAQAPLILARLKRVAPSNVLCLPNTIASVRLYRQPQHQLQLQLPQL